MNGAGRGAPLVLLATTLRWPLAARLAIALRRQGCAVQAWCPRGHPLEHTQAVERIHRSGALAPLRSLRRALEAAAPDFVLPCDDDAAVHLHELRDRLRDGGPAGPVALIERSLGTPASCTLATTRGALMALARDAGVRVPATAPLAAPAELDAWTAQHGFPAVLKVDRSWGGLGVSVIRNAAQAREAFQRAAHPSPGRALSHWIVRRDASQVLRLLRATRPVITVQALIAGRPANRAVLCRDGEVLAGISAVALQTRTATGPATVVQVIEHPEMTEAAARLVRALGLSGLCGLDFIVEGRTGAAWLIEVNPRATPICHLPPAAGPQLPAALHAWLAGIPVPAAEPLPAGGIVAMFPGEWCRDPRSAYLRSAFHDVPWEEKALVRDCVALPWEERGWVARLRARSRPLPPRPAFPPAPAALTRAPLR